MAYYDNIGELDTDLRGAGLRVGIVMSRFNAEISEALLSACITTLSKLEVSDSNVLLVPVPGALEIPITLQKLAISGRFDVLIALGAVIRGDTYHFEVVANESANGLMSVQLDTGIPVVNGILTTDNDDQAIQRTSEKGAEVARAAIEMANLMKKLNEK